MARLSAPKGIKVSDITEDYAHVTWGAVRECCESPKDPPEYCACNYHIWLNGVIEYVVGAGPYTGLELEELLPGTEYTVAIQTYPTDDMYESKSRSKEATFTFTTKGTAPEPPVTPTAKITKAGIITELKRRGPIDTAAISTVPSKYKWYMYKGQLSWFTANFEKGIEIRNLQTRNPPAQTKDLSLTENKTSVNELDSSWVLARLAELIYMAAPITPPETPAETPPIALGPAPPSSPGSSVSLPTGTHVPRTGAYVPRTRTMSRLDVIDYLKEMGGIDVAQVSRDQGDNKWFYRNGRVIYQLNNLGNSLTIRRVPPSSMFDITFLKDGRSSNYVAAKWALERLAELPYRTAAPVTTWESQTVCGWINTIGVARLTEDHGRYIYSLAIGWATLANDFYNMLSPKPAKPSAAIVTEDNGRGVYGYAIGWNTLANEFTGCTF